MKMTGEKLVAWRSLPIDFSLRCDLTITNSLSTTLTQLRQTSSNPCIKTSSD
ncbi:MAG: hypothetical protein RM021_022365 [Nostoc sp. EkiNYC01]|nr:hypothetical protein [Nostoc sp. EkiNYC01]